MLSLACITISQLSIDYLRAIFVCVLQKDAHDKMFNNNDDDDDDDYDDDDDDDDNNFDNDDYDGDDFDMSFKRNLSFDVIIMIL